MLFIYSKLSSLFLLDNSILQNIQQNTVAFVIATAFCETFLKIQFLISLALIRLKIMIELLIKG